jgi:hypothetical protein
MATPILMSVAIPFPVGYIVEMRRNWWALIPAWVMMVISVMTVFAERARGEWIAALALFSIALPFLAAYLADRRRRYQRMVAGAPVGQ